MDTKNAEWWPIKVEKDEEDVVKYNYLTKQRPVWLEELILKAEEY